MMFPYSFTPLTFESCLNGDLWRPLLSGRSNCESRSSQFPGNQMISNWNSFFISKEIFQKRCNISTIKVIHPNLNVQCLEVVLVHWWPIHQSRPMMKSWLSRQNCLLHGIQNKISNKCWIEEKFQTTKRRLILILIYPQVSFICIPPQST